ncbi:hypothetical protein [Exiguobacterium sp. HVEsp1]|uniref:hypothetical protein n=1 Tax=Exiguobacterium sp. HVEsp1 TaxID=1934003 RepID=UPI0014392070|nr:hypothetical protein [Exiguobacterium sp. HVEsp1]
MGRGISGKDIVNRPGIHYCLAVETTRLDTVTSLAINLFLIVSAFLFGVSSQGFVYGGF